MAEIPLQTEQTATVSLAPGNVWQVGRDQESFKKKKKRYLKVFALWGIEREMCTSHFSHDITLHTTQEHSKVNRNIFNQLNVFFLK